MSNKTKAELEILVSAQKTEIENMEKRLEQQSNSVAKLLRERKDLVERINHLEAIIDDEREANSEVLKNTKATIISIAALIGVK